MGEQEAGLKQDRALMTQVQLGQMFPCSEQFSGFISSAWYIIDQMTGMALMINVCFFLKEQQHLWKDGINM